jgi:hypothetical protein
MASRPVLATGTSREFEIVAMSVWDLTQHNHEEVRQAVIDILLGRANSGNIPRQFTDVVTKVGFVFGRASTPPGLTFDPANPPRLHPRDGELVRDVFWDLFRQGMITLGIDSSQNSGWPWFQLSPFGENTLQSQGPYRFHDIASSLALVRNYASDISAEAVVYLEEAVAAFYADCLLSSCVMLGVAAETEFLRLLDIAASNTTHGASFQLLSKGGPIQPKIVGFHAAVKSLIPSFSPRKDFEDFDVNFSLIQSVIRIARNDAGHPTGAPAPVREQVYVFIQLFEPFARQLMNLRVALR